jgi:diphthamide biosynthesis enzyme Dph1/Dph2-like protein
VNTACPRIGYDDSEKIRKPILNIDELKALK